MGIKGKLSRIEGGFFRVICQQKPIISVMGRKLRHNKHHNYAKKENDKQGLTSIITFR